MEDEDVSALVPIISLSAITASLCCLPSIIWVLFAGSSAIVAADSLSNDLYYSSFRYVLYSTSILMLVYGLMIYFRNRGICTLDDAKKNRRRIINTTLLVFTTTIIIYLVWNYIILEMVGIYLGLPWEDSAFWNN
ncbi:MAG: hypothetical protein ACKVIR_08160 [Candidatus Poseidoniales archaeon]